MRALKARLEFKKRFEAETLDDLLPEAFAVVKMHPVVWKLFGCVWASIALGDGAL